MGHFVIYTFGNVDAIYNILMSIATFFGGGTFLSMVKLAGVTTLLLFLFNAVGITARGNINQPLDLTFFIKFYMAYWLLAVAPAGQVTIVDKMTGVTKVVAVSGGTGNPHVPLGLVLVNSYMSQFFNALINAYETYFETGASGQPGLGYTKSGMAFGSNFVSSANTFTSGNMQFDTNLQNYFANCALPIANNVGAITSVAQSGDLLEFFRSNFREQQQVRYVVQLVGTNNTRTITRCDTAVDNLSSTWTGMTDNVFSHLAKSLGFNDSPTMYGNFIAAGGVTSTQLLGVAGGMAGSVKQAIAMNIAYKAIQSNAMQVNSNALANAAYDAQQFQQYKAGGELSGEMAARITPAMKIFAESLLFMFYPFMVFYCLVTSNFLPFLKYIKFVATVNAIPFVFEVLNACINWYAQAKSGMAVTDGGFTLMNSSNLYSLNANIVAAANYLSMSVPAIAFALIHGSDIAITGLFSHSSDPAKSAASSAAGEAGKGNMNLGNSQIDNTSYGNLQSNNLSRNNLSENSINRNNISEDNVSMHQHNTAPTNKHGSAIDQQVLNSGTVVTQAADGSKYMSQQKSSLAIDANIQSQASKQIQHAYNDAASNETRAQQQLTSTLNDSLNFVKQNAVGEIKQKAATLQTSLNASASYDGGAVGEVVNLLTGLKVQVGAAASSTSSDQATSSAAHSETADAKISKLNATANSYNTAHARTQQLSTLVSDSSSSSSSISPSAANMLVAAAMNVNNGDANKADAWLKNYGNVKNVIDDVAAGGNKYGENIYEYNPSQTATAQGAAGTELNAQLAQQKAANTYNANGSTTNQQTIDKAQAENDGAYYYKASDVQVDSSDSATGNAVSSVMNKLPKTITVSSYSSDKVQTIELQSQTKKASVPNNKF